ncbi:hypothetical protein EDD21DRAFT_377110 [Dissophora ornata]|nr:RNA polymerase I enhancer binding protein [Dissophora ornata]KAI8600463.1 hypothetical protein EDD21DRAFT_377110 [Dissophora ornata]
MENQTTATKKRKNSEDALNASFKKALVSSTGDSDDFGNGLGEFNILGNTGTSSESTQANHHQQQDSDSVAVDNHGSISDLSLNHSTPNSTTVDAASAAVMTTMADLLANAGDSSNMMAHSSGQSQQQEHQQQRQDHDIGGVSDEVLRMQQQLQQQIPLSPSTDTRLTREQIIESIASIPDMRLLIEQSLKGNLGNSNRGTDTAEEQQHQAASTSHTSTLDASSVLMNLGDPSILATLKPTINLPNPPQSTEDSTQGGSHDKPEKDTSVDNQNNSSGSPGGSTVDQPKSDPGAVTSSNPLHTKWLMATALKEKQIAYKTGTFSSREDELIRQTIKDYVARNNMPEDAIERWFENGNGRGRFEKNDLKALWVEIAVRLQTRPLLNIYLHVRRMFHPQNNVGAWSKEDDQKLIQLYAKHKGQWTTIGTELGRMADSCRDRYRNHLKDQSTMVTGPWQPHEDEKLLTIMQDLALQQGKANILDSSPMWTLISERMEGTRTRHQCRHRYSQTLQPRLERGEWTAPSSAAAVAAATVAANAAVAANVTSAAAGGKQQQQEQQQQTLQLHDDLGLDMNANEDHSKTTVAQDVLMLAAALQGVLPTNGSDNMLWTQAMSANLSGSDSNNLHDGAETHLTGDAHHEDHDDFSAAAFASIPIPALVPMAPKGPIRRRSGLQQQLDVLRMIQEDGYTDHTDIKWADIAQRLRDRVEEADAIQLARIVQTHDRLDSKKQQQLQDGDSTAAASAAMAAAVSAAQAEAVASLQRVPAANQIARTFMSSRCKFEGYKEMTLQQVIIPMMEDVERRIQHRRGASTNPQSTDGSASPTVESAEGGSSSSSLSKTVIMI